MRSFASKLSIKSLTGKFEDDSSLSRTSSHLHTTPARSTKTRSHNLFSKAPKTPVDTAQLPAPLSPPSSRPALTPGSSASSDGSASLRTPDDDGMMGFLKSEQDDKGRKKWSSFFGRRKSSLQAVADGIGNAALPPARNPQPPPIHDSPIQSEDEEGNDDDEYGAADTAPASSSVVLSPATYAKAQSNLRVILRNRLIPPTDTPPLIDRASLPFYPRSTGRYEKTPFRHSLESAMHTRRMLRRVERKSLTRTEHDSIAAFGARPKPEDVRGALENAKPFSTADEEETMSYASMRVYMHSRGLRIWALRPCFEERYVVYAPGERGQITLKNVQGVGRGLGVPEIEISDHVAFLSGIDLDDDSFDQALISPYPILKRSKPVFDAKSLQTKSLLPVKVLTKMKTSADSTPPPNLPPSLSSPLLKASASVALTLPIIDGTESELPKPSAASLPLTATTAKRGVRFAEESDPEDGIPLGYAMNAKKKKEEKAAFLRVEKEKRERAQQEQRKEQIALEEKERARQRAVQEEQRRKQDEDRRRRDERARTIYAEEVAAARHRIESARFGIENVQNLREARQREQEPVYSRPAYDSDRKNATDYFSKPPESPSTGSGDSRPPSFPSSVEDVRRNSLAQSSRPSSIHDSSVEDLRSSKNRRQSSASEAVVPDNRRISSSSRPMSVASTSRGSIPRSFSSPIVMPVAVPVAVPAMPYVNMGMNMMYGGVPHQMPMWNMPLLPPAPPFMMQHYSGGPQSPGGSRSKSRSQPNSRDSSPSRSRQSHSVPNTPDERPSRFNPKNGQSRGGHSRQGSGDATSRRPSGLAKGAAEEVQRPPIRVSSYTPPSRSQSGFQNLSRQSIVSQSNNGSSRNLASSKSTLQSRLK